MGLRAESARNTPSTESLGTVLVVDDIEANRYTISHLLRRSGFQVLEASTGEECLALARSHCPDLIILDVKLPDINGFEVCACLKGDTKCGRTPVIQISATFTEAADHLRGVEGGADAFLTAPIDPMILLSTVKSWLRVRRVDQERDRAVEALKQARNELSRFIMQSPTPMVILSGPELRFTLANAPYEKLVGREVVGKLILEAFSKEEAAHFIPRLTHVMKTGEPYIGLELPFLSTDENGNKKTRYINVENHPFRDDSGEIVGVLANHQEVTEQVESRKKTEAVMRDLMTERHRLETIFRESPAAMVLWRGTDLIFEKINPAFNAFFPGRELLNRPLLEACPELVGQPFADLLLGVLKTGVHYVGNEMLAKVAQSLGAPLEDRYFDFVYLRIEDTDGNPFVYCHAIDATERVLARRHIQNAVRDLETERELRERFVATLTHDLRTPLTAAKMSGQMLSRLADDPIAVRKVASRISENMERADQMIQDLLDANQIRAGSSLPLEAEDCDLTQITADTLQELSTIHGDRFVLRAESQIRGYCSKVGIRRMLENLCNNAVKYGTAFRPVTITLTEADQIATIDIHNEGSPIPSKDLPTLFEPYRRTDSAHAGAQKGWGLGLTLVKGIAESHGGNVAVESTPETGTTFTVKLPLTAKTAPSPTEA